eukprot:CAMPEP_0172515916 /NCGR_PEP_ID=MMETSP1066-20121228/271958_1 /TAXON_ID=671091 /ORGANISM="Coscinodiscus wailesii, Strain CCMP2513" /LENGTH=261 /DNA_ID=CAMNT_0013297177 /DNA_START=537 /DNA_END=1322 /DNA_ORIENTATION=-
MNIAIGNVSLRHVSVNFNQVMRSLVPAITLILGKLMGKFFTVQRQIAVVPVVLGVAMACYGDMSYTSVGLMYTIFCILLAAVKAVLSGEILTGDLKLHPVDLLARMAPLAMAQCLVASFLAGEIGSIAERWETELSPAVNPLPFIIVMMSAVLSFSLNISSLMVNKLTSPLTLCIGANAKQVILIVISTVLFGTEVTILNGAGICVVLAGSSWYSYVSVLEKMELQAKQAVGGEDGKPLVAQTKKEGDEEMGVEVTPLVKE